MTKFQVFIAEKNKNRRILPRTPKHGFLSNYTFPFIHTKKSHDQYSCILLLCYSVSSFKMIGKINTIFLGTPSP